jgi:hypothetical protein
MKLPRTTWVPGSGEPRPDDGWLTGLDDELLVHVGVLLFDRAQGFEAHEAWELAWRSAKNAGREDDERMLRALIKLAAAMVKVRQRQQLGVVEHAKGARALLVDLTGTVLGVDVASLADVAERVEALTPADVVRASEAPVGAPMAPFGRVPRHADPPP